MPRRFILLSDPSGKIHLASDPVVFARTFFPLSRNIEAMIRVTLDFPRVPVTLIRIGIASIERFNTIRSAIKKIRKMSIVEMSISNFIQILVTSRKIVSLNVS